MKKKIFAVMFSILLLCLVFALSGCEKAADFPFVQSDGASCVVVYAENDDALYKDYVKSVTSLIGKITGAEFSAVALDKFQDEGAPKILIGDTGLPESDTFITTLKYSDYGFGITDGTLCVAGHTLDNTTQALCAFEGFLAGIKRGDEKFLSRRSDGSITLSSKGCEIISGNYVETKIDGVSLDKFSIVCNEADKKYADDLRVWLGEHCGAVLNIKTPDDATGENEILLGDVGRELSNTYYNDSSAPFAEYKISVKDGKLAFFYKNNATLAAAYEAFIKRMEEDFESNKKLDLKEKFALSGAIESNIKDRAEGTDVRIASNNIYLWERSGRPISERCHILYNSFALFDADVLLLQEVSSYWHETMDDAMVKNGYTIVPTDDSLTAGATQNGNYTPIWYRADRVTLIDNGYRQYSSVEYRPDGDLSTSKSYTWALFEDKNASRFICLSTHFTWAPSHFTPSPNELLCMDATEASAAMKQLKAEFGDIPIILIGDLNCSKNSDPYNILKADFVDILLEAAITHNTNYGTYHSVVGEYPAIGGNIIDHAFGSLAGAKALQYQFVLNEWSINSTDHIPILLDLKLK